MKCAILFLLCLAAASEVVEEKWSQSRIDAYISEEMGGIDVDGSRDPRQLYVRLLRDTVAGIALGERELSLIESGGWLEREPLDVKKRRLGTDWPWIGTANTGLDNLNAIVKAVIRTRFAQVPGDVVDTGVWRGGTSQLFTGALTAYNATERRIFVVDPFQPPTAFSFAYKIWELLLPGTGQRLDTHSRASLEAVRANFYWTNLLDETRVRFLPGTFDLTLPSLIAQVDRIAILRVSADSPAQALAILNALYSKLSEGGIVLVDGMDRPGIADVVTKFRSENGIGEELRRLNQRCSEWTLEVQKPSVRLPPNAADVSGLSYDARSFQGSPFKNIYVLAALFCSTFLSRGFASLLFLA